jgi:ketopantoate reductase
MASKLVARMKIRQQAQPYINEINNSQINIASWQTLPLPDDVREPIVRAVAELEAAKASLAEALEAANRWEIG